MVDVEWHISVSTSLFLSSVFQWMLGKQAPDALKEGTSGGRAQSVFMLTFLKSNQN